MVLAACGGGSEETPFRIAGEEWEPLATADTAVGGIEVDPSNPSIIYAYARGMLKSTDRGATWRKISDEDVTGLTFDPYRPRTMFGWLGRAPGGLVKSTDGGRSWSLAQRGISGHEEALAVDPTTPNTLYVATTLNGVFKSGNGGASWSSTGVLPTAGLARALVVDSKRPSTLYLGVQEIDRGGGGSRIGILKSANSGRSWRRTGFWNFYAFEIEIEIDPRNPRTLYALLDEGVHKSEDGGATWRTLRIGHLGRRANSPSITFDPNRPETLYLTALDAYSTNPFVFKSTTGGRTWVVVGHPERRRSPYGDVGPWLTLVVDPTGRRVYAVENGEGRLFVCKACWKVASKRT